MRILILVFMLNSLLFGFKYDGLLLKAQATIFPKIMLLDKKLEEKLVDGKIIYTIVYDKSDYNAALKVSKFINANHKGLLDRYVYKVNLVEFSEFSNETEATAIYALNLDYGINKVANVAKEKGIVSFSYDIENLKKGFLFSLMLEKSTVIYLNKDNLYTKKVDFVDSLYQIVRFIDKDNS